MFLVGLRDRAPECLVPKFRLELYKAAFEEDDLCMFGGCFVVCFGPLQSFSDLLDPAEDVGKVR